jgi:hypothetical protein
LSGITVNTPKGIKVKIESSQFRILVRRSEDKASALIEVYLLCALQTARWVCPELSVWWCIGPLRLFCQCDAELGETADSEMLNEAIQKSSHNAGANQGRGHEHRIAA